MLIYHIMWILRIQNEWSVWNGLLEFLEMCLPGNHKGISRYTVGKTYLNGDTKVHLM